MAQNLSTPPVVVSLLKKVFYIKEVLLKLLSKMEQQKGNIDTS